VRTPGNGPASAIVCSWRGGRGTIRPPLLSRDPMPLTDSPPRRHRRCDAPLRGLVCLATAAVLLAPARTDAQLARVETDEMRLVYVEGGQSYLVPHAARTFLNALAFQKRLFDYEPTEEITALLLDFQDSGNASATVVPRNAVTVQIAPLGFTFETIAGNDRMNLIMNHELVHVAAMDQAARRDRAFRRLFGGKVLPVAEQPESMLYFFLTTPRVAAPRWYHEGLATFVDTWMAGGLGRAQGGYDEMVFRSMVRDGTPFYDPLGLVSEGTKIDFQQQINSYLYGTRFMTWLARTYGPDRLVAWAARHEGSRGYYSAQFRRVFDTRLEDAWRRWTEDEVVFQQENLEAIRAHPVTPHKDVTARALGSVSRAWYDRSQGMVYAAFNYPGAVAHVGSIALDTGEVSRLVDIKGPVVYSVTSLAYDDRARTVFYTTDNGAYRDLVRLDPATRRTQVLQRDARIGDLAFNRADASLWGIRTLSGLCTLVRIPAPYTAWEQVHTWPYGTVVYDLDVAPDGRAIVASFGQIDGSQDVRVIPIEGLRRGDPTPTARFDFGTAVPNHFVFSPDGRHLYGSSYYTGVSNIFRYEVATGELELMSNTETGFFRPVPIEGEDLLVFRYSGAGFVPARIPLHPVHDAGAITFLGERLVAEHPVLATWNVGSPARIPWDEMETRTGRYRLAGGLRRESIYPVVQGYKDTAAVGLRLNLSDPLQLNRAWLSASWSPDASLPSNERLHLTAEYQRFDWRGRVALNSADFYDLVGPTKTGRKGYVASVGHRNTLIYDQPRRLELDLSGSVAGKLDRLPEYQNVPVDVDRLYTFEAALTFTDVRNSLGSVDDETGRKWSTVLQGRLVDGIAVPKIHGTYDRGFALPLGHSSVWIRSAAGYSPRDRTQPFANFFFGGFGNNYLDRGNEKRYREYYALPGASLNEVGGRNFVKSLAEWNLPPWRFSHAGTPGFHLTWVRPAIFAGGLVTNLDDTRFRRRVATLGGQLDFRFSLLSVLDMTVSAGGALAAERGHDLRREAMVSVKILR
jgi:hypothetical protein